MTWMPQWNERIRGINIFIIILGLFLGVSGVGGIGLCNDNVNYWLFCPVFSFPRNFSEKYERLFGTYLIFCSKVWWWKIPDVFFECFWDSMSKRQPKFDVIPQKPISPLMTCRDINHETFSNQNQIKSLKNNQSLHISQITRTRALKGGK